MNSYISTVVQALEQNSIVMVHRSMLSVDDAKLIEDMAFKLNKTIFFATLKDIMDTMNKKDKSIFIVQ